MVQGLAVGHGQGGVDMRRLVAFGAGKALDLGVERTQRQLARARGRQRILKAQVGLLHHDAVDRIAPGLVLGRRASRCGLRGRSGRSRRGGRRSRRSRSRCHAVGRLACRLRQERRRQVQRAVGAPHSLHAQPFYLHAAQLGPVRQRFEPGDVQRQPAAFHQRLARARADIGIAQRGGAHQQHFLRVLLLAERHRQARVELAGLDLGIAQRRREGHEARYVEPVEIDIEPGLARIGEGQHLAVERQRRAVDLRAQGRPRHDLDVMRQVGQERQRQRQVVDAQAGVEQPVVIAEAAAGHGNIVDREARRLAIGRLGRHCRELVLDIGKARAAVGAPHHAHGKAVDVQVVHHRSQVPQRCQRSIGLGLAQCQRRRLAIALVDRQVRQRGGQLERPHMRLAQRDLAPKRFGRVLFDQVLEQRRSAEIARQPEHRERGNHAAGNARRQPAARRGSHCLDGLLELHVVPEDVTPHSGVTRCFVPRISLFCRHYGNGFEQSKDIRIAQSTPNLTIRHLYGLCEAFRSQT
ncbi:hypothetical protein D9M68_368120 [compost metagenome]